MLTKCFEHGPQSSHRQQQRKEGYYCVAFVLIFTFEKVSEIDFDVKQLTEFSAFNFSFFFVCLRSSKFIIIQYRFFFPFFFVQTVKYFAVHPRTNVLDFH